MWVFTKEGAFSAVWDKRCRAEEILVRSHSREDLCRLAKRLAGYCESDQILETTASGYRYGLKITKQAWSAYLADCALQVDYPSVRDHLLPDRDPLRRDAYYQVWEALYRWRAKRESRRPETPQDDPGKGFALPFRWRR